MAALETDLPIMTAHPGSVLGLEDPGAYQLLHHLVCFVHPLWEARVGELDSINVEAAAPWNHRRLVFRRRMFS